ncbi:unnamed protein product [Penicillium camemberti]|uniref:Str. FM013 n=1 Tax=Penicillium camemberti (strain FM 013) TaxID=1429867 RepID=A0A0G4PW47_PENC3|nr:unnamed protein product [Penicillium camemberti]
MCDRGLTRAGSPACSPTMAMLTNCPPDHRSYNFSPMPESRRYFPFPYSSLEILPPEPDFPPPTILHLIWVITGVFARDDNNIFYPSPFSTFLSQFYF